MTRQTPIRCALYDRVSSELQVADGLSLDAQKDALTAYAKAHGYKIVDVYTDEGITARKKMQNRKELQRLLEDVKADKIDLILVTKLDRWFRNIKDYHNTQAILEEHNCNWKTIFEEYDTTTANGRFAINIMLSVNENECDRDSDRIKEVFRYKIARGEWLGGKPPFGYMRDENSRLIKNPATAPLVQEMFDNYFITFSKTKTIEYMLEKYGSRIPSGSNLSKMFSKEIYTGFRNGVQICEPFISGEQFHQIQKNSRSRTHTASREIFFLSGLIECPYCGQKLIGKTAKKIKPSGNVYYYKTYACRAKWVPNHPRPNKFESVMEKQLLDIIEDELLSQIRFITKEHRRPGPDTGKLRAELNRLNLQFQKGRIDEKYYDAEYDRITALLSSAADNTGYDNIIKLKSLFSGEWKELYLDLDAEHKRAFWKSCLDTIYIDKKSHNICGLKFNNSR